MHMYTYLGTKKKRKEKKKGLSKDPRTALGLGIICFYLKISNVMLLESSKLKNKITMNN